jgi:acyl-CoA thioesterase
MENRLTPFSQLLASLAAAPDGLTAAIGDDWRQGRTLYGGLSAALCVEAASRALPESRPLRAAQFAFVGPASGVVTARPALLRQGKSTVFAGVDLHGDAGLATRALLCFAAGRTSTLAYGSLTPPKAPPPESLPDFFDGRLAPAFSRHFEAKRAGGSLPMSGAADPDLLLWIRHRDRQVAADATALVALADAAPPAAMTMFTNPAPISTMTWSLDILADPTPATMEGWILMRSTAQTVSNGYSTQAMFLWDQTGTPLMSASQCVAVFA